MMWTKTLLASIFYTLSIGASAGECDYETILFSYLAKQHKSTEDCFLIDPRDVSAEGKSVLSLKVREKHNKKCGGDPETMPSAGIFKVTMNTCVIEIYNVADDVYLPISY